MPPQCFGTDPHEHVGAWGIILALASPFGVFRRQQDLWSTLFLCLVPGSAVFGDFCVRQPTVPRVSTRFFESFPFEVPWLPNE